MDYFTIAKEIRKKIFKMKYESQEGHIGSALSCVDILCVLYNKILRIDPTKPEDESRDRFILSKGHAISALYAVLAQKKFFDENILDTYCKNGSKLSGHSSRNSVPGVEVSTGSLGHGLPMAAGIALAGKKDKKNYRVFVLMSDGECDEGTTWEAALFASQQKLSNLVLIIDYNKWQAFGKTKDVLNLEPFAKKWENFGWSAKEISGHDFSEIEKTFLGISFENEKPNVIIAHTIKGKGLPIIEDTLESHYHHLTKDDYEKSVY